MQMGGLVNCINKQGTKSYILNDDGNQGPQETVASLVKQSEPWDKREIFCIREWW